MIKKMPELYLSKKEKKELTVWELNSLKLQPKPQTTLIKPFSLWLLKLRTEIPKMMINKEIKLK